MASDNLSDKYKREVKRNKNLTERYTKLLIKLSEKDKLIVEQDRIIGERNLEIQRLKAENKGKHD